MQNILGEFNKEQEEFIKSQQGIQSGVVPWAGHQNEEKVKEEILGLSAVNIKLKTHLLNIFISMETKTKRNQFNFAGSSELCTCTTSWSRFRVQL